MDTVTPLGRRGLWETEIMDSILLSYSELKLCHREDELMFQCQELSNLSSCPAGEYLSGEE